MQNWHCLRASPFLIAIGRREQEDENKNPAKRWPLENNVSFKLFSLVFKWKCYSDTHTHFLTASSPWAWTVFNFVAQDFKKCKVRWGQCGKRTFCNAKLFSSWFSCIKYCAALLKFFSTLFHYEELILVT